MTKKGKNVVVYNGASEKISVKENISVPFFLTAKKDIVAVGALDSPELPASIDCLTQPACIAQVALLCACICSDRAKQLRLTLDACSFLHSGTIGSKWLPLS